MSYRILQGDVLDRLADLPSESVHCVVTSPPYWGLRDYGVDGQIGLEATPAEYLERMVAVFRQVRRVLRSDGTCWVNMGDGYASNAGGYSETGSRGTTSDPAIGAGTMAAVVKNRTRVPCSGLKAKDLIGMPWRLAFALQEDGWWLRQDIIWAKPNPMPESVTDRCTKAHEYVFLLTKSAQYFYDAEAIRTPFSAETKALSFATMDYERRDEYAAGSHKGSFFTKGKTSATKPDVGQGRRVEHAGGANKRSVWSIPTEAFPEAHFATFPTALVEPCIKAGTSEHGVCEACGAPWQRVVGKVDSGRTQKMADGWAVADYAHGTILNEGRRQGESGKPVLVSQTMGWLPSCACKADAVPGTVLDPFSGAGTTGLVALRLGRHYLGVELNPEYVAMSERRLRDDRPLLHAPEAVAPQQSQAAQHELAYGGAA